MCDEAMVSAKVCDGYYEKDAAPITILSAETRSSGPRDTEDNNYRYHYARINVGATVFGWACFAGTCGRVFRGR